MAKLNLTSGGAIAAIYGPDALCSMNTAFFASISVSGLQFCSGVCAKIRYDPEFNSICAPLTVI